MSRDCYKGCDPQTDETGIECNGDFVSEECVVLNQNTYLDITAGQRLSHFIAKVVLKFKSIFISLDNKIDKDLETFTDDAAAGVGGISIGEYYLTDLGYVKKRLS